MCKFLVFMENNEYEEVPIYDKNGITCYTKIKTDKTIEYRI